MIEPAELIHESKSAGMTPEIMKAALEDAGYEVDVATSTPVTPSVSTPEPQEIEEEGETTAARQAGEEDEGEGAPVAPPASGTSQRRPNGRERKLAKVSEELGATKTALDAEKAERARLQREIEELRARSGAAPATQTPAAPPVPPSAPAAPVSTLPELRKKPTRMDFMDQEDPDAAFTQALAEWSYDARDHRKKADEIAAVSAARQREADARQAAEADIMTRQAQTWKTHEDAAKSTHPDYDAVLNREAPPNGEQLGVAFWESVLGSEIAGPDLIYEMAQEPGLIRKIHEMTKLPPNATRFEIEKAKRKVIKEIERIETKVATKVAPVDEQEDDDLEDDPPAPPARVAPPVAAAPPAAPPVAPRRVAPAPVRPVGNRGGRADRTLSEMRPEEVAALTNEDVRRMQKAGLYR